MLCRLFLLFLLTSIIHGNAFGQEPPVFSSDLETAKKPWTHLNFHNDPDQFQFAIVTDRTGSPRPGIFEDAVRKLNWLRPEFVMSVGDLIRGLNQNDSVRLVQQWQDHFERIAPLKMPFFHLAGNHDIKAGNQFQVELWNERFGAPFYSFRYKDVLFLALFSNETFQTMSLDQVKYFEQVLEKHQDVRWTLVFMHHPLWVYPHMSNFDKMEALLADRNYTVFAGHQHRYRHFPRKNTNYYILATTGGGSGLLGNSFGMFDHVTWVTMTNEGPVLANLRLDGILPHDVSNDETAALSQSLINSVFYESDVFVDDPANFSQGQALLTYSNSSDLPIHLNASFFHNHDVLVSPATLDVTIPAQARKTIQLDLKAIQPFDTKEKILLEMDAEVSYKLEEHPDLKLGGRTAITITPSNYQVLPTEMAEFVGEYTLQMKEPLPGTRIHYTLDGSIPDQESPVYTEPLKLTGRGNVLARLYDDHGWPGLVDTFRYVVVEPGPGVICKYYEQNSRVGTWRRVPNFSELSPVTVKVSQSLDPMQAGPKSKQFGVVYKGFIELPESGEYEFSARSDDGAVLFIDGKPVVSDPVKHRARTTSGTATLEMGKHACEIHYYNHNKKAIIEVFYKTPGGERVQIDISHLTYGRDEKESTLIEGDKQ